MRDSFSCSHSEAARTATAWKSLLSSLLYPVNLAALQHQRIPTMASTSSSLSTYELCSQSVDPNLSDLDRQVFLIIIYVHQSKFILLISCVVAVV
jgi:hypothetical protein